MTTTATPQPNASGRANRMAPDGSLHAVADRGMWWANRGYLLGDDGTVRRHWSLIRWITCVLEYKGITRNQWRPGRLTELYSLDEPTSLAAGHRPCALCRHDDFVRYRDAWRTAFDEPTARAPEIDERLQADRLVAGARPRDIDATHRTYDAVRNSLPDGTIVELDSGFWLLRGEGAYAWGFGGYTQRRPRATLPDRVTVRTPRASVAVLAAGYVPLWHPSLSALDDR